MAGENPQFPEVHWLQCPVCGREVRDDGGWVSRHREPESMAVCAGSGLPSAGSGDFVLNEDPTDPWSEFYDPESGGC
jgi:hypothetical protein